MTDDYRIIKILTTIYVYTYMFDVYSKTMLDLNYYNEMLRIKIINYFKHDGLY